MRTASSAAAALVLSLLAQVGTATISIGKTLDYDVAWITGESACNAVKLSPVNEIPCDRPFTLSNGFTYVWKGCGSQTYLLNGDGTFNHVCSFSAGSEDCGVERAWKC